MNVHKLKIWPEYFEAVIDGSKTFELRKIDRRFRTGDRLELREWEPSTETYTGRSTSRIVGYVLPVSLAGREAEWYAVLSLLPVDGEIGRGDELAQHNAAAMDAEREVIVQMLLGNTQETPAKPEK